MRNKSEWGHLYKTFTLVIMVIFACQSCAYAGDVEKLFKNGKEIWIDGTTYDEDIDLTEILDFKVVKPGVKVANVYSNVVFNNCMFKSFKASKYDGEYFYQVHFHKDLIFNHCAFNGDVDLSYATMYQDFSCLESEFAGKAVFSNVWFKGRSATFASSHFFQKVKLTNVIFENKSNFMNVEFAQNVSFNKSVFKGNALLGGVTYMKYVGFSEVAFNNGATLDKSVFQGKANFMNTLFVNSAGFSDARFEGDVTFNKALFLAHTYFAGTQFNGKCDTEQTAFLMEAPAELVNHPELKE
ncbi:hypothetical protein DMA11_19465 [Marinilabiliaceae bacterium JC017]|nr:hypothetical protein DMA11_19465 [Marinilabiliaceae bacterium JC017]